MLIAVEHLGGVGVGITGPQFIRADDGRVYVVKLKSNRLGTKVLSSEFLAAEIGKIMGLCFPPSDLIAIKREMLAHSLRLAELGAGEGLHFASRYLDAAQYVSRKNWRTAANLPEMAGVILFDHLFHNADRANNQKNLLLRQENGVYRIYAIDNSHLFRSGRWTAESLAALEPKISMYYRYSFGYLLKDSLSAPDFTPYLEKVTQLADATIDTLVQNIPAEWLSDAAERRALTHYIKIRRGMAEEICQKLLRYIPEDRGGRRWLGGKKRGSEQRRDLSSPSGGLQKPAG